MDADDDEVHERTYKIDRDQVHFIVDGILLKFPAMDFHRFIIIDICVFRHLRIKSRHSGPSLSNCSARAFEVVGCGSTKLRLENK